MGERVFDLKLNKLPNPKRVTDALLAVGVAGVALLSFRNEPLSTGIQAQQNLDAKAGRTVDMVPDPGIQLNIITNTYGLIVNTSALQEVLDHSSVRIKSDLAVSLSDGSDMKGSDIPVEDGVVSMNAQRTQVVIDVDAAIAEANRTGQDPNDVLSQKFLLGVSATSAYEPDQALSAVKHYTDDENRKPIVEVPDVAASK